MLANASTDMFMWYSRWKMSSWPRTSGS